MAYTAGKARDSNRNSLVQNAGFVGEHDRDAVADRISKAGLAADQFTRGPIIFKRALGNRTNKYLEQARIKRRSVRHRKPQDIKVFWFLFSKKEPLP
jgi:hypothetical protein